MKDKKIGVAVCGSFCTFSQVLPVVRRLARDNTVTAVLSPAAGETDTRFYRAGSGKSWARCPSAWRSWQRMLCRRSPSSAAKLIVLCSK